MTDTNTRTANAEVYGLLEQCTAEELAPIVDGLIAAPVSFLRLTRGYERYQPDHIQYTDQIGDEVYRLSMHALAVTDGLRPTYQAMIAGLCKQIGFAASSIDLADSEQLLINTFTKRHILSLSAGERTQAISEAAAGASAAAAGVFSSDAWPPLASALTHLAYLRSILIQSGKLERSITEIDHTTIDDTAISTAEPTFLSMHVSTDNVHLTPQIKPVGIGWRTIESSPKLSGAMEPILQGIQPLMAAAQSLRSDELLRRLPEGVKGTAHIVEAGTKGMRGLETVAISSLMGPMAIMMLAAAVAEQKKLDAIEKSLGEIKTAVADISRFQQEERRSVLKGSIRYFQQIAPSVFTDELAPEVLHEIERHEVELVRVQEHLTAELREAVASLRAVKKETFGSGKFIKALQDGQSRINAKYDELILCLRARACGYQLLCAFPGRQTGKAARFSDIIQNVDALSPMGEITMAMDAALRERLVAVSSYETKSLILGSENSLLGRVSYMQDEIREGLRSAHSESPSGVESLAIDLRVENGMPVAVRLA